MNTYTTIALVRTDAGSRFGFAGARGPVPTSSGSGGRSDGDSNVMDYSHV